MGKRWTDGQTHNQASATGSTSAASLDASADHGVWRQSSLGTWHTRRATRRSVSTGHTRGASSHPCTAAVQCRRAVPSDIIRYHLDGRGSASVPPSSTPHALSLSLAAHASCIAITTLPPLSATRPHTLPFCSLATQPLPLHVKQL